MYAIRSYYDQRDVALLDDHEMRAGLQIAARHPDRFLRVERLVREFLSQLGEHGEPVASRLADRVSYNFV